MSKLGDVLEVLIDHRGKTPKKLGAEFVLSGVPVLSALLVTDGQINWNDARFVSEETWMSWMPVPLKKGDVLLTSEAPLGRTALIDREGPVVLGQRLFALRGKSGELYSKYLHYWFRSSRGQSKLGAMAQGTTVVGIRQAMLREIEIELPQYDEQCAIADVLGTLDDKIAANQRVQLVCTELQRSIWLRAVNSVAQVPFSCIASPVLGGTPSRKELSNWMNEVPWSSVADMTATNGTFLLETAEGISRDCANIKRFSPLPAGAVLLSARGTVGKVVTLGVPAAFNQSAYGFVDEEGRSAALRLAVEGIVSELESKAYGSVFSTITKSTITECTAPDVFHKDFEWLHQELQTIEDVALAAAKENQILARTRDELLPLLMNGKITVAEAEEEVGAMGVDKRAEGAGDV